MRRKPWKGRLAHPRILLFAAAAYTVGILLGANMKIPVWSCILPAGILLLLGIFLWGGKRLVSFGMAAALCIGIWAGSDAFTPDYPDIDLSEPVTITGCVQRVTPGETYSTYKLTDVKIEGTAISEAIFLQSASVYAQNDLIMAQAELSVPSPALHPGDFDDYQYCRSQKVMYRGFSGSDAKTGEKTGLIESIYRLNLWLGGRIEALFPKHADLAKAFILGDEGDVEQLRKDQLQLTGMTHILSISGSHIAILAGLLHLLFRRAMIDRRIPFWIGQAVMLFYTILTGWKVSMVRAFWMYEVAAWIKFLGKRNDPLTTLAIAYLGILAGNPAQVYDLGLQLSFSAVFGMLCLTPQLEEHTRWIRWELLRQTVCAGIAAAVSTFPITVNISHYYWFPGILANSVATMYSALMIPVLMGVTALYLILGSSVGFLGAAGAACIHGFDRFVAWCAEYSGWGVYLASMLPIVTLLWFLSLFVYSDKVFLPLKYKRGVALAMTVLFALTMLFPSIPKKGMYLQCFAEEHFGAILQTEEGERILFSDGSGEAALEYTLDTGSRFENCIITDIGEGTPAIVQLYQMKRIEHLYADVQSLQTLQYKYGITAAEALPNTWKPSAKMQLHFSREGSTILLETAGEATCLFVLEFHENIAREIGSIPILYYNKGVHSELPQMLTHDRFIYADRNVTSAYGQNLYQTGMLEIDLSTVANGA